MSNLLPPRPPSPVIADLEKMVAASTARVTTPPRDVPPHDPNTEHLTLPLHPLEVGYLILAMRNFGDDYDHEIEYGRLLDKLTYLDAFSYLGTEMDAVARKKLSELHASLERTR